MWNRRYCRGRAARPCPLSRGLLSLIRIRSPAVRTRPARGPRCARRHGRCQRGTPCASGRHMHTPTCVGRAQCRGRQPSLLPRMAAGHHDTPVHTTSVSSGWVLTSPTRASIVSSNTSRIHPSPVCLESLVREHCGEAFKTSTPKLPVPVQGTTTRRFFRVSGHRGYGAKPTGPLEHLYKHYRHCSKPLGRVIHISM